LKDRPRAEGFLADKDCMVLKLPKEVFQEVMEEFPDIADEVTQIAEKREGIRL